MCVAVSPAANAYSFEYDVSHQASPGDGRSIGIEWQTDYGRHGLCRDKAGTKTIVQICTKDMAENTYIRYRVGMCNVTASKTCTKPADYDWAQPGALPWTSWILNNDG
jgi:hypothetical protein